MLILVVLDTSWWERRIESVDLSPALSYMVIYIRLHHGCHHSAMHNRYTCT